MLFRSDFIRTIFDGAKDAIGKGTINADGLRNIILALQNLTRKIKPQPQSNINSSGSGRTNNAIQQGASTNPFDEDTAIIEAPTKDTNNRRGESDLQPNRVPSNQHKNIFQNDDFNNPFADAVASVHGTPPDTPTNLAQSSPSNDHGASNPRPIWRVLHEGKIVEFIERPIDPSVLASFNAAGSENPPIDTSENLRPASQDAKPHKAAQSTPFPIDAHRTKILQRDIPLTPKPWADRFWDIVGGLFGANKKPAPATIPAPPKTNWFDSLMKRLFG